MTLRELVEIIMDRPETPKEIKVRLFRAARGGFNECGERLWYPTRIWNNQEDR